MRTPDERVRSLAERQHGIITRRQALASGLTDHQIHRRSRIGQWRRLDPGTYLLFGSDTPEARLAGAVVALPAVVSHRSAARAHGLPVSDPELPEVTVPHRLSNRFAGVQVHESTDLDPDHVMERAGLPTTNVARTVFDIALGLSKRQLRRVVDEAMTRRLLTVDDLENMLAAVGRRGRPGTARMRCLVADLGRRYIAPESELERRMIELLTDAGLPDPVRQLRLPWRTQVDGRVDFAYPSARLIVECDGRRWHTTAEAFERDRRRDNQAQMAGWRVLRFTWDDVTRRPAETARQVKALLQQAA